MIRYLDKDHTFIDTSVQIGDGTTIYPNVMIEGNSKIGSNCIIHFGTYIKDSIIEDNVTIYQSHIEGSKIEKHCVIGPYANIRPDNHIADEVKIGAFVEVKHSEIGTGSKIPHLSYIGDTKVGKSVNIGCGVVTANFDGKTKQKTVLEDHVFIGCNSILIAPVTIQKNSFIGAGTVITEDLASDSFAVGKREIFIRKNKSQL